MISHTSRPGIALIYLITLYTVSGVSALAKPDEAPVIESISPQPDQKVVGTIIGDPASGFKFKPNSGPAVSLESVKQVDFAGPKHFANLLPPPFRVEFGLGQRISGRLASIDQDTIQLEDGPGGRSLSFNRAGVGAVVQRAGTVQVLFDPFERVETGRWVSDGAPKIVEDIHVEGAKSLRIPATGASLSTKLDEPVSSGRFDIAFHDDGKVIEGRECSIDLIFRAPTGNATVRAILGWEEESLAVQTVGETGLQVQRLARRPGWHRLTIEFGPVSTMLSVDGDLLAKGKSTGGPLSQLKFAGSAAEKAAPAGDAAIHLDDLQLVRFADVVPGIELDVKQDEIRTAQGDQVFGTLLSGTPSSLIMQVGQRKYTIGWSEASGAYFQRKSSQSALIHGLLVRARWRASAGDSAADIDEAEGALVGLSETTLKLETPYAGTLSIPRNRMVGLIILGKGRRLIIDAVAHHLGNETIKKPPFLDPPQAEGDVLEVPFTLAEIPTGDAFAVLDVVQVVGMTGTPRFSSIVEKGELRTKVYLNDKQIDDLNSHIFDTNEKPERIRLPIPKGLLQLGPNKLRLQQFGYESDPKERDDLGVLTIAIEFAGP